MKQKRNCATRNDTISAHLALETLLIFFAVYIGNYCAKYQVRNIYIAEHAIGDS